MKIGIDIDGTLTSYPEFFTTMGKLFREAGHKIYIVTGLGYDKAVEKIGIIEEEYGTGWYDEVISTRLYDSGELSLLGRVENEVIVGLFKNRMCNKIGIDIMFDDNGDLHRLIDKRGVPTFTIPKDRRR